MDTVVGAGDLGDLLEARRRIVAAFEGIAAGAEALAARAADADELDRVRAELMDERVVNAQLQERLKVLRDRESGRAALEEEIARLRAELTEVRAAREADRRELDALLTELLPIVEEAR
jgi:septal ring factor EnvC (AmiA/AmiB activator)